MSDKPKTIITKVGPVRMSYANVFKPRRNELSGKDEYSAVCLIPKSPTDQCADPKGVVKTLMDAVKEVAAEAKLKAGYTNPLKDGDDGDAPHPGYWFFRVKTGADYPPHVCKPNRAPCGPESGYVSGDWAKVAVNVKAFDAAGNKGVTCYLSGVMWLSKDEPLGGGGNPFGEDDEVSTGSDDFDPFLDD